MDSKIKTIKIIELAENPWEKRWSACQEALKKHDVTLEVKYIKTTPSDLEDAYKNMIKESPDVCIVGDSLGQLMLKHVSSTTQETEHYGAVLLFIKRNGSLWPRSLYDEALVSAISNNFKLLDLMAPALVAGAGAESRFIVSALAKIGFNKISLTDQNAKRGIALVEDLKKKFFNVEFKYVKFETITTLPGVYSLVVNATPLNLENQVLDELYFFNFLKAQGVVIDISLVPPLTPLLSEAEEWGARLLSGDVVAAEYDSLIIKEVLGVSLNKVDYCTALRSLATSVPFDLEPYLQRFLDRN